MRAIIWAGPHDVRLTDIPEPKLCAEGDAIVRVEYASTCGTDLHIFRGAVPGFEAGTVLGHECVGLVHAVGPAVTTLVPGMRVWSSDCVACGTCVACLSGRHTQCERRMMFGFSGILPRLDGSLAEFVRVPYADNVLTPLPADTDPRAGLLASDVLPTALGSLERSDLKPGARLGVIGAGPVGLLIAHLASQRGVISVVLEKNPARLDRARAAGFTVAQVDDGMNAAYLRDLLGGPMDAVIDAVGGKRGLTCALMIVRRGGQVVGIGSQAREFEIDWGRAFQSELQLSFVIGNPIRLRRAIEHELAGGRLPLATMFSDEIPLYAIPDYYPKLLHGEAFKAVVHIKDSDENSYGARG